MKRHLASTSRLTPCFLLLTILLLVDIQTLFAEEKTGFVNFYSENHIFTSPTVGVEVFEGRFGKNYNENFGRIVFYAKYIMDNLKSTSDDVSLLSIISEMLSRYPETENQGEYARISITPIFKTEEMISFSFTSEDGRQFITVVAEDIGRRGSTSFRFEVLGYGKSGLDCDLKLASTSSSLNPRMDESALIVAWRTLWYWQFRQYVNIDENFSKLRSEFGSKLVDSVLYSLRDTRDKEIGDYSAAQLTDFLDEFYTSVEGRSLFSSSIVMYELARRSLLAPM